MTENEPDLLTAQKGQLILVHPVQHLTVERDFPAARLVETADHVEQGGFARTGSPHERNKCALFNRQADAAQGKHLFIVDRVCACDIGDTHCGYGRRSCHHRRRCSRFIHFLMPRGFSGGGSSGPASRLIAGAALATGRSTRPSGVSSMRIRSPIL